MLVILCLGDARACKPSKQQAITRQTVVTVWNTCCRSGNGTLEEAREALAEPQAEVHLQVGWQQCACALSHLIAQARRAALQHAFDLQETSTDWRGALRTLAGGRH